MDFIIYTKNFIKFFKKKLELIFFGLLIIFTIAFTSLFNQEKNQKKQNLIELINNVYLKKTLSTMYDNFEPKYSEIEHKVKKGEKLKNILDKYSIKKKEINELLKILETKIKINKIKTNDKIKILIDQTENRLVNFSYKIEKDEIIYVSRSVDNGKFILKTQKTKLNKNIVYNENTILNSLYKSAVKEKIPVNIIVEFARIYGFQVDFQRDIRKNDYFQIMFETFNDKNNDIIETGNILYANLNLSGINYPLYYFDQKFWGTLWW